MIPNRFLVIFAISFIVYFILDYVFSNAMLYIMGGVVEGSISEAFKVLGIKAGLVLISLVWVALLIGVVVLFYRLNSNVLKYSVIVLIAALLYIIDMLFAGIPYSETVDAEKVTLINNIVIGFLILLKSLILSLIIYFGIIKN